MENFELACHYTDLRYCHSKTLISLGSNLRKFNFLGVNCRTWVHQLQRHRVRIGTQTLAGIGKINPTQLELFKALAVQKPE